MAASKGWNIFDIDLETAFLHGQSYGVKRDVVCQLPPEAGHPIPARLKKPACGRNDATRCWWNILDKALCGYGMVPTRADGCCYVSYSTHSRERTRNPNNSTHNHDAVFEKMLNPIAGSPAAGTSVAGIIDLFVGDLLGTGGTEMEQRILARLAKDSHVGSEDWNDVTITGQRIRRIKDSQSGPCIEVSRQKAIDELEEIPVERNTKEDLHCTPAMHTRYRSLLGQINWLQSRTQSQCYKFSRCASKAASPTIGGVKALNKLARQLESQPVKLQFWPLTEPSRIIGFPDASYRNNEDGSSQRGMTVFLAESRERSSKDGMSYGSPIDNESPKIKKDCALTTVAKTVFFYDMLWFMPVSPWIMDGHFWCSCNHSHED